MTAVQSIASWILSDKVQITLRDLLEVEHAHPGLLRDVDTCIWQVYLIKQQMDADNG